MATLHSKIALFLKDRDQSLNREDASEEERAASSHKIIDMIDAEALSPKEGVTPLAGEAGAVGPLASYDAGLLSDYGGGNVEWWQDYVRLQLAQAHEFYFDQWEASLSPPKAETETGAERERLVDALSVIANGQVGDHYSAPEEVVRLLMEVARAALSTEAGR